METAAAMPIWPEPVFAFDGFGGEADGEDMIRNLAFDLSDVPLRACVADGFPSLPCCAKGHMNLFQTERLRTEIAGKAPSVRRLLATMKPLI
jgi:hypothetical protein